MLPLLAHLSSPPSRLRLCTLPSPVEQHAALARRLGFETLLVKRDDLNGAVFGGNKLRGLEWLLPVAGPGIVTMGGYGSTWCAALAWVGRQEGRRVFPTLIPQPWSPVVAGVLATTLAHGQAVIAGSRLGLPLALARAWRAARRHGQVTWIPAGGATPLACLGSVNAALELAAQLADERLGRPDAIVVPLGSGGTAAGLLVGCWIAGWDVDICAVRVADPWLASRGRVMRLVRAILEQLEAFGLRLTPGRARLRVIGDQLGAGYGHPTAAAVAACHSLAEHGISVDLTYGAKTYAALRTLAASFRRPCFWHTFDQRLRSREMAEHPLLRKARAYAESSWPHLKSTSPSIPTSAMPTDT